MSYITNRGRWRKIVLKRPCNVPLLLYENYLSHFTLRIDKSCSRMEWAFVNKIYAKGSGI